VFISAFALLITTPLRAQDNSTFESVWNSVVQNPDCKPTDYSDFVLVNCNAQLTLWYFTKPNHPAHPGVVKRQIYQEKDGTWLAREEGRSFASDAAQPAFKTWLAQIADLDRQMREEIGKQKSGAEK
jgi:hypothetical protein